MFTEVIEHLEQNSEDYTQPITFYITSLSQRTLKFLDINFVRVKELPEVGSICKNVIYYFPYNGEEHCIYSYGNGIIFTPGVFDGPYKNIYNNRIELIDEEYKEFKDLMIHTCNHSGVMSVIKNTKTSHQWCLLVAYLDHSGYSIADFIAYAHEEGPYKKLYLNVMHFLCIFTYYCHLMNIQM